MEKLPDWQCPNPICVNSKSFVFGSKPHCPKCGSSRDQVHGASAAAAAAAAAASAFIPGEMSGFGGIPGMPGVPGQAEPGDWACPNTACVNHTRMVFRKKASCPSCGTPKNAMTPGDWQCPNTACVNSRSFVFNSKSSCPKCGSPRPEGSGLAMAGMNFGAFGGVPVAAMPFGGYGGGSPSVQAAAAGITATLQPGGGVKIDWSNVPTQANWSPAGGNDWVCPTPDCVNHKWMVYGKHESCPKCGVARPAEAVQRSIPTHSPTGSHFTAGDNPLDWNCPNPGCCNHKNKVFAKHAICPKCFTPRPAPAVAGGAARGRSRSPYR